MRKLTSAVCGFCALAGLGAHAEFYATGGEVTRDGEYVIHTFTNATDTFTVTGSGEIEVLLVGGGGGGGYYYGGGGGGGAVVYRQNISVTAGAYSLKVGEGGAGATGTSVSVLSQNGGDTEAFDLIAHGGGGGGSGVNSATYDPGSDGASGGGGGAPRNGSNNTVERRAGGAAVEYDGIGTQGFGGGCGVCKASGGTKNYRRAGGGGGAGGPGGDAVNKDAEGNFVYATGGDGGAGVTNSITGRAIGYGGGGGGGANSSNADGQSRAQDGGGRGGRATGTTSGSCFSGANGTDGLGGGGGGGGGWNADGSAGVTYPGGKGGCGAVIVRYKPTWPDRFEKIEVTGNYSYQRRKIDGVRYGLYTFTNDVSLKVTGNSYADLLLVGGGGGGGKSRAGGSGGGGGGVVETNRIGILGRDEPYVITIGAGGAGGGVVGGDAQNGGDTMAFGFIAHGGGAGGWCNSTKAQPEDCAGADGACGGGAAPLSSGDRFPFVSGGKAIWPGEGFDGGCATNRGTNKCWGGGGGGAGGVGGNGYTTTGTTGYAGAGGVGRVSLITGLCYGGGGGGGQCCFLYAGEGGGGAGGEGGGGNGSGNTRESEDGASDSSRSGINGVDGLGGGGGGAGIHPVTGTNPAFGGTGGCGTVILRVREEEQGLLLLFR